MRRFSVKSIEFSPRAMGYTIAAWFALFPVPLHASAPVEVHSVTVVGVSPVPGGKVDLSQAPYDVQTLSLADFNETAVLTPGSMLESRLGSVSLNDNLDNPFQPDILYRGFAASPVLGTSEGLAVFQNGVRINEAFGDVVNWDLIPSSAIARLDLVGANPVYGLNALGGAVVVTTRSGFEAPTREIEVEGGTFGRRSVELILADHGAHIGAVLVVTARDDAGWRAVSTSRVRQAYSALSFRQGSASLNLSYTHAENQLEGEGAVPVQELAINRRDIFTSPQVNANRLDFLTLNGAWSANGNLSLQTVAYARRFAQRVENGDTTAYVPCATPSLSGVLCQPDGATPLHSTAGADIPDFSQNGLFPIGENDRNATHALTYGGALQVLADVRALGGEGQTTLGVTFDGARVAFSSSAQLGRINSALSVQPSGVVVATSEGEPWIATPVALTSETRGIGLYGVQSWNVSSRLSLTASARYTRLQIHLTDQRGAALSGESHFSGLNPAVGLTYQFSQAAQAYLGASQGSRVPTASEIECADPSRPCVLPSSLSADPPTLKQVVSHTVDTGLRGEHALFGGHMSYSAGLYRTDIDNDLYFVATALSAGYVTNIAGTRRQGGDVNISYQAQRLKVFASVSHVEATFLTNLVLPSPSHPLADANGDITVRRGDVLPGVPRDRLKTGFDFALTQQVTLGGALKVQGPQFYRGDEANLLKALPGYGVVGLHATYQVLPRVEVRARLENVFNRRYATFGALGDPTGVNAPGVTSPANPRFQSPAAPLSGFVTLKAAF